MLNLRLKDAMHVSKAKDMSSDHANARRLAASGQVCPSSIKVAEEALKDR